MKINISLSGWAGGQTDLETLRNVVPNGQFTDNAGLPIMHNPSLRYNTDQGQSKNLEPKIDKVFKKKRRSKDYMAKGVKIAPTKHHKQRITPAIKDIRPPPIRANDVELYSDRKSKEPMWEVTLPASDVSYSARKILINLDQDKPVKENQ